MDKKYLMGFNDAIDRTSVDSAQPTFISAGFERRMCAAGIRFAMRAFADFFGNTNQPPDDLALADEYQFIAQEAQKLGLNNAGGIREKDHLCLWCLGKALETEQYVESGVFMGSSLHAILRSKAPLKHVTAIDPNLGRLSLPHSMLDNVRLIDKLDFEEIDFENVASSHMVYFDDHINAAKRILQAHSKGFRTLLFDDAIGLEGMCQRLYPAFPPIPMILHHESLKPGDELQWTFAAGKPHAFPASADSRQTAVNYTRVGFRLTEELIALCKMAYSHIEKVTILPDLGPFICQMVPEKMPDSTKYLVLLKS